MQQENSQQLPQQVNLDLSKSDDLACKECSNKTFDIVFVIKQVSALLSPTGKPTMVPVQIFKCSKCNNIPDEFLKAFTDVVPVS